MQTVSELIEAQRRKVSGDKNKDIWGDVIYNVKVYGAKGDGETDDSDKIQSAVDDIPTTGGILFFPDGTYKLGVNISFGTKQIMVLLPPSVRFTGAGKMPSNITNANHNATQNYWLYRPNGGAANYGDVTMTAEISPADDYVGNAVAGYFGAMSGHGAGQIWALNPIAQAQAGFTGNMNVVEIDVDNFAPDAGIVTGLLVTGVGTQHPDYGFAVIRGDEITKWATAVLIKHCFTGIELDGAINFGMIIKGMEKNHIKVTPSSDTNPGDAVFFGTNAADSVVNFQISKSGTGSFNGGLQVGGGTLITKHMKSFSLLNFPSIAGSAHAELTITVTGAAMGDSCYANPDSSPEAGLIWSAFVSAADTVTVRLANITAGAIDPVARTWIADVWKH